MKPVNVSLQLPSNINRAYENEAKERITSKSAVMREVLVQHVRAIAKARKPTTQPA